MFNSLVRDKGSQKILPVPAATVVQQFDVEAGSGDANNRSEKFRGQETLKGAGGQVDRGAGGGWEKARPRGNLSMGIRCNKGAEKPESHESGLAGPPTGGAPRMAWRGSRSRVAIGSLRATQGSVRDESLVHKMVLQEFVLNSPLMRQLLCRQAQCLKSQRATTKITRRRCRLDNERGATLDERWKMRDWERRNKTVAVNLRAVRVWCA
jgi:hypothetical protein